jgi:hypothetical protein
MQPLRAKVVVSNKYSFSGLNSISDNLVFINRDLCRVGIISGVDHSGKSFAVKREITNKLMNSDNEILLITPNMTPYANFVKVFKGDVYKSEHVDFFMLSKDQTVKQYMFEAYMSNSLELHKKRMANTKKKEIFETIKKEAEILSKFNSWNEAMKAFNSDKQRFATFGTVLKTMGYMEGFRKEASFLNSTNRLNVVEIKTDADLIISIATAMQYRARKEAEGKCVDIFIDGIDPVFFSFSGGNFVACFADEVEDSKSYLTMVIQDAVRIWGNADANIEFSYFLDHVSYFKLLAQGPIERRFYSEKLNIPTSLLAYLTDIEPGEGVIMTRAENVAFNDRFETKNDPFYSLFYV